MTNRPAQADEPSPIVHDKGDVIRNTGAFQQPIEVLDTPLEGVGMAENRPVCQKSRIPCDPALSRGTNRGDQKSAPDT